MERLQMMISRATNPQNEDLDILALDSFSNLVRENEMTFAQPATKLIVAKVQSSNTKEALLALEFLEGCMDCCGHRFVQEVGKFKFLNELIKLVSKKHLGDQTPKEIQNKILDILFTWTTEYPEEPKIKEAYDMLKHQGIVHEPTKNVMVSSVVASRKYNKTELDPRQTMLKKLINSKNKDDIAKANLLIQNMCREDERRIQIKERRITEYKKACESVTLLNEMLESYDSKTVTSDDLAIINEIHDTCDLFQPTLLRLIHEMDKDDELVAKVLEINDTLIAVLDKYRRKIVLGENVSISQATNSAPKTSNHLLDDILSLETPLVEASPPNINVLDVLGDIFNSPATASVLSPPSTSLLEPQKSSNIVKKAPDYEAIASLAKETNEKKDKPQVPKPPPPPGLKSLDLDSLILGMKSKLMPQNGTEEPASKPEETIKALEEDKIEDDAILDSTDEAKVEDMARPQSHPIKSLAEIHLALDAIQPSSLPPRVVLDESQGLKISLNFVKDRPRDDVLVVVISTINQGPISVQNFQLDASVPKPCKLRLLPPSGTEISGVKLFQPPSGIFQILLVANPTQLPVKITCILSYCLNNDPDPVKESIEVSDVPYKCE